MYASVAVMRERERERRQAWLGKWRLKPRPTIFFCFVLFFLSPGHFRVFLMGPYTVSVTLCVNAGLSFSFFSCGSNLVEWRQWHWMVAFSSEHCGRLIYCFRSHSYRVVTAIYNNTVL